MLLIHSVIALTAVFDNYLYVVKPPNVEMGYVTYDQHVSDNQTRWILMKSSQLGGVNIFKTSLTNNITEHSIVPYKVKFYSKGYTQETGWQYSILKEPPAPPTHSCKEASILIIPLICIIFFTLMVYVLYHLKHSCNIY